MKQYFAAAAIAAAVTGCASTPPTAQSTNSSTTAPGMSSSAQAARPAASPKAAPAAKSAAADVGAAPGKRSVYFDYDSNTVKDEFVPVVQSNASYLAKQRVTKVRVEGNTDERGSREYNLALGQRRADAVKQRLTLLGVPGQQIETVSFGEEKPRAEGEDEKAYAENRRADIVYAK